MGPPLAEAGHDELAHFLTVRYRLFTLIAGRLAAAEAEHPPWPLRHVEVLRLDQNLLQRAGLPEPAGDPLAHASPGVPVRIGLWHWRPDAASLSSRGYVEHADRYGASRLELGCQATIGHHPAEGAGPRICGLLLPFGHRHWLLGSSCALLGS
jgi:hypothetical protein